MEKVREVEGLGEIEKDLWGVESDFEEVKKDFSNLSSLEVMKIVWKKANCFIKTQF